MTLRGGGRPRDPRTEARPLDDESWVDEDWRSRDARWAANPARNGRRRGGGGLGIGGLLRFLLFALVMAGVVLVGLLTVLRPVVAGVIVDWAYDNQGALRIPFVADIVRERLGPELTDRASGDSTEVEFEIVTGDTPKTLATRLMTEGLIKSEKAFLFEATRAELTPKLQAGNYSIARNLTPAEVVTALVENRIVITVVSVNFREQLRLEQVTAKLQTLEPPVTIDAQEFYDIVKKPPAELLADYPWLTEQAGLPEGASLEGFLGAATYDVVAETTAEDLVRQMLDAFYRQVGPDRMVVPSSRGMTFYQVMTLASLVEREAVLDDERWLIAGVYQNRLDGGNRTRLLEADPTVLYAIDTVKLGEMPFDDWKEFAFWNPVGVPLADVALPEALAGYNTYKVRGLPPGPICTPSVASIDAALQPDTTDKFLFFLAIPGSDPPGAHDFSKTLDEHNEKKTKYGYT
jgi:peptidoglycan lytic transglycosylase G